MDERRRTPRASCRLHCIIRRDGAPIRARIVDLSEGGLCIFSPVWLEAKNSVEISIDVPGVAESIVRTEVWHVRRQQIPNSNRKIWVIGAMLDQSDDAYLKLLAAAGIAPTVAAANPNPSRVPANPTTVSRTEKRGPGPTATPSDISTVDEIEPKVFRVRVQARTGPRTRLLTITAESVADARALATQDLQPEWRIIEVLAA
jgi:PilZ domain